MAVGFEICHHLYHKDLRSRNDLLVVCLHFQCLRRGFVFVGVGETFADEDESATGGSEMLPDGWNQSQDTYVLRYINPKTKEKLLVKAVKVSDILIVSALIASADSNGSSYTLQTNDLITDDFKTYKNAFVSGSVENVLKTLDNELIDKIVAKPAATRPASTESPLREDRQRQDPLRQPLAMPGYGHDPYGLGAGYDPMYGGAQWPPPYGGADLDPLGRAQGGMIMDPRNFPAPFGRPRNPAPGLPRGAVPPGARFDPFGPPGVGPGVPNPNRHPRQHGPDPDHMPPPGYDDMFS